MEDPRSPAALQKTINPVQFLVFGFGSIVGTGWVVLLGVWLARAGPAGAALGLAAGGAAMALVASLYAELGSRLPQTGGEVTYINAVFGKRAGFVVGWLLTLAYVSVIIFEGVALGWLLDMLWPPLEGPVLYSVLGYPIGAGNLGVAIVACLVIAWLNYRGAKSFVRFQNLLTGVFLCLVALAVCFELGFGSTANLQPLWQAADGGSWLVGALWVSSSAPFVFNSFQSVLHAIEERSARTSKEFVARSCVFAVVAAALFYVLVVLAAAFAAPRGSISSSDLPAVAALAHLPWSRPLTVAFLVALVASVLKTWNSVFMMGVRLVFAQARDGMIPPGFGSVNPRTGAPGQAVLAVAALNLAGLFIGRGVLEPVVDMASVCVGLINGLVCAAAVTMRLREPRHTGFRAPGGMPVAMLTVALAFGMTSFALLQPGQNGQATTLKWAALASWAVLGFALYLARNRRPFAAAPVELGIER